MRTLLETYFTPLITAIIIMVSPSELILNPDGSIYHLNLRPENIANDILFVGDQDRVDKITEHFDSIEFTTQKREFKTTTGKYNGKRISVISTGIGNDNIDIVLNELDALVNIDFESKQVKTDITSLNIVRIGTSGSLQEDIPVAMATFSFIGVFALIAHFIADISYAYLDPRIRIQSQG